MVMCLQLPRKVMRGCTVILVKQVDFWHGHMSGSADRQKGERFPWSSNTVCCHYHFKDYQFIGKFYILLINKMVCF